MRNQGPVFLLFPEVSVKSVGSVQSVGRRQPAVKSVRSVQSVGRRQPAVSPSYPSTPQGSRRAPQALLLSRKPLEFSKAGKRQRLPTTPQSPTTGLPREDWFGSPSTRSPVRQRANMLRAS